MSPRLMQVAMLVLVFVHGILSADVNIVTVRNFTSGATLVDLQHHVTSQHDSGSQALRCRPGSCVLPQTFVRGELYANLRAALQSVAAGMPVDVGSAGLFPSTDEKPLVALPSLRSDGLVRHDPDFHDDLDVDVPSKSAMWIALLYLQASEGDRFLVRGKVETNIREERDIQPGTLVLFDSSKVQHAVVGSRPLPRMALGPVALDNMEYTSDEHVLDLPLRGRILGWGSSPSPAPPSPPPPPPPPACRVNCTNSNASLSPRRSAPQITLTLLGLVFPFFLTL